MKGDDFLSVKVFGVTKGSFAEKAKLKKGDLLLSINGQEIVDVLDYRFYQNEEKLTLEIERDGKRRLVKIKKGEYDEIGLEFETYLMDKQRSCKNNCIFCFIDQLPKGLRESLYFKDDDSRLSFLFGNYITLTNITDHEIDRIIKMHISPINVSVHTTNPKLRQKMMNNRFAGDSLNALWRICDAKISVNCQLVLCPGYNDGEELERSLEDLLKYENVESIACVPVGLTAHREGLKELSPFDKKTAGAVIDIIEKFGDVEEAKGNTRRVYPSDEFFILAEREIPKYEYFGEFKQLENGVGMSALFENDAKKALEICEPNKKKRTVTCVTGEAAATLISRVAKMAEEKSTLLSCNVVAIKNEFFGGKVTVAGLVTATDIINQLRGKTIGDELIIPDTMLRREGDLFLDDKGVGDIEKELGVKIRISGADGFSFIEAVYGE